MYIADLYMMNNVSMISDCGDYVCLLVITYVVFFVVFFFKQKTAYEMRISDWSSDVCSSDLVAAALGGRAKRIRQFIVTPDTDKADAVEVNIVLACANAREYDGIRAKLCNLADVREIEPRES